MSGPHLYNSNTPSGRQIFLNYQGINQLACTIGNSILIFPEELTEKLIASNSEDNVACISGEKQISIPRKLLKLRFLISILRIVYKLVIIFWPLEEKWQK